MGLYEEITIILTTDLANHIADHFGLEASDVSDQILDYLGCNTIVKTAEMKKLPLTNRDKWYSFNTDRNSLIFNHPNSVNYEFIFFGNIYEHKYYRNHLLEGIELEWL